MVVGVCKQQPVNKNGQFFTQLRLNTSVDHMERGRTSPTKTILPAGYVSAP